MVAQIMTGQGIALPWYSMLGQSGDALSSFDMLKNQPRPKSRPRARRTAPSVWSPAAASLLTPRRRRVGVASDRHHVLSRPRPSSSESCLLRGDLPPIV
jgi:hypothetical protein